ISILTHLSRGAIAYRGVRRKEKVGGPVSVPLEQLPDEEQHECPRSKRLGCLLGRFFVRHINHVGAVAHCFDTGGNNVIQGGKAMTRLGAIRVTIPSRATMATTRSLISVVITP